MRTFVAVVLLAAGAGDELGRARDAMRRLDYPEALKALAAAEAQPDLEPAQLIELYELQGVALATLKKKEAVESFRKLLTLSPEHRFDAARAPRVMTPYYEARDLVKQSGALQVTATDSHEGETLEVRLALNDPLKMVQAMHVELTEDGSARQLSFSPGQLPAKLSSTAARVDVAVTLLGVKGHRLQVKALHFEKPPAAPPPLPPSLTAEPAPPPPPLVVHDTEPERPRFMTGKRITGVVLLGVSLGALIAAGFYGADSVAGRQRWQAAVDGTEPITYDAAVQLNSQVTADAFLADLFFLTCGVAGLTGLLLLVFGGAS